MMQNALNTVYYGTTKFLRKNGPTILSFVACGGVLGTSVSMSKATVKTKQKLEDTAEAKGKVLSNLEIVAIAAPIYLPSVILAGSTIACILGANVLNRRQQATLASAYALAENQFKEYREKLIELHGKEIDEEIRGEIARKHYDRHVLGIEHPDQKVTWYEPYSNRFFEMYEREVMDAEYHLNRNFILGGATSLNDYYKMLGLSATSQGDNIGWCVCDGYMWIDFEHRLAHRPDRSKYYIIQPIFSPMTEEEMEECGYML